MEKKLKDIVDLNEQFVNATWVDEKLPGMKETISISRGNEESIGKYSENNNILAFVDRDREVYVGRATRKARESLETAGYSEGNFYVPFSNDGGTWIRKAYEKRA